MYGLITMHKENNPVTVIPIGCSTALESLTIFVEKYLYKEVYEIDSRIKDTVDMLNITDMINDSNILTEDFVLVSFDIVNMFSSINNVSSLECALSYVWNTITLCNKKYYLKEDGIAMGPHIPCSYSDITMYRFDLKALSYSYT